VFATPEEDAHRRDFTINGMFYDPLAEQLLDFVGGRDDLDRKVVRAIGDPLARFGEDKLRMLRAVRIAARFDFELDGATADSVRQMAREILVVSHERIADELQKMLVHPRRARAVALAHELDLLTVILPELAPVCATAGLPPSDDLWTMTRAMLDRLEIPRFELALAALLHEVAADGTADDAAALVEQICRRLKLSNQECRDVAWLVGHRDALQGAETFRMSRLKRLLAEPLIHELLALESAHANAANESQADVEFCQNYLRATPTEEVNPPPLITGDDLKALGIEPGPQYKEILERVRDAQLDGVISTREEALELVLRLVSGQ
jgi:poly(A) polymerase